MTDEEIEKIEALFKKMSTPGSITHKLIKEEMGAQTIYFHEIKEEFPVETEYFHKNINGEETPSNKEQYEEERIKKGNSSYDSRPVYKPPEVKIYQLDEAGRRSLLKSGGLNKEKFKEKYEAIADTAEKKSAEAQESFLSVRLKLQEKLRKALGIPEKSECDITRDQTKGIYTLSFNFGKKSKPGDLQDINSIKFNEESFEALKAINFEVDDISLTSENYQNLKKALPSLPEIEKNGKISKADLAKSIKDEAYVQRLIALIKEPGYNQINIDKLIMATYLNGSSSKGKDKPLIRKKGKLEKILSVDWKVLRTNNKNSKDHISINTGIIANLNPEAKERLRKEALKPKREKNPQAKRTDHELNKRAEKINNRKRKIAKVLGWIRGR